MRKLIQYIVMAFLAVSLAACSWFETQTVEQPTTPVLVATPSPQPAVVPQVDIVIVERGHTLSELAGKKAWREVCRYNQIKDCDVIKPGQVIRFPAATKPALGVDWRWKNVGGAPLNKDCGPTEASFQKALPTLKLAKADEAELRRQVKAGQGTQVTVPRGTRYAAITFCRQGKIGARYNAVLDDPDTPVTAREFRLPSGAVIHQVDQCGNWNRVAKANA